MSVVIFALCVPASFAQTFRCPDQNGRPFYSNIACDANNRPIPSAPVYSGGQGGRSSTLAVDAGKLLQMMDAAAAESEPRLRRSLINQVHSGVATFKANAASSAQGQAEAQAQVPDLEKMLREAQSADKASVGWYQGIGDSQSTRAVRADLLRAREFAIGAADRLLRASSDYQRVLSHYELVFATIK